MQSVLLLAVKSWSHVTSSTIGSEAQTLLSCMYSIPYPFAASDKFRMLLYVCRAILNAFAAASLEGRDAAWHFFTR